MRYSSTRESYSEVYEVINFLGDEYIKKIPRKLYEFIKNNRDKDYKPNFNKKDIESLNETSISRKAIAIIAFLNWHYWIEDEKEKQKLEKIYSLDQERFKAEVIENYDDELLCNSGPGLDTEETTLPEISNLTWYRKIFIKILNVLKRRKKKSKV